MTSAQRITSSLRDLGWSSRQLAARARVPPTTAWRWVKGEAAAPESVVAWLEELAGMIRSRPAP